MKDTPLGRQGHRVANLPCHRFDANAAWLEISLAATDLGCPEPK
jgi:hypothetical protein